MPPFEIKNRVFMKVLVIWFVTTLSLNLFAGNCPCPNDSDKRGYRCGERSSFCRIGGYEPLCGAKTQAEVKILFKNLCPKKYSALEKRFSSK